MKSVPIHVKLLRGVEMLGHVGVDWLMYRARYALSKHSGLLKRRFPALPWDAVGLSEVLRRGVPTDAEGYRAYRAAHSPPFFFKAGALPNAALLRGVMKEPGIARTLHVADDYCRGRFLYYSREGHELGWPPDWLRNPFTGGLHETETHWCDYATFSPSLGDIKDVWEPSRFAAAFWLTRAYALTGDEKYPEAFWQLVQSWCRQNPPNRGPNWKCGQETSIRLFGWCFALYGFWNSPATNAARVSAMLKAVALQAERVYGNIDFAVSQKNNHGLSEAAGLITIGLLFPELRGAKRWLCRGKETFEQEVLRQIYLDGGYVQHSMNYHRVMLHDCLWASRLVELSGEPFSREVRDRIARGVEFFFQMLDTESGDVPNYGANDGALLLPLSACDYRDYRATAQAARYQATGRRVLPDGPWNEMLIWLYGAEALRGEPTHERPASQRFDAGGYYTLRGQDSWCMIRCHTYRDRPDHVDVLHLDLWHKGVNILGDSGSYKYYCPEAPALGKYFKDIAGHNTIEMGGQGPLELVSRFLWLPWPTGRCTTYGEDHFEGEHEAYDREPWNVIHRRGVRLSEGGDWLIRDELDGDGRQDVTLRWHLPDVAFELDEARMQLRLKLPDGPVRLVIAAPEGARMHVLRGEEGASPIGWQSLYYGEKSPRPTLEIRATVDLPASFTTRVILSGAEGA